MQRFNESDLHWFPLRIRNSSYARLSAIVNGLNELKEVEEAYAPFRFMQVSRTKMDFAPILLNFVFVRSSFQKLVNIKRTYGLFEPLRFIMHPVYDERYQKHDEVLYMSDKSMNDYKRITAEANDKVIFLDNLDFAGKKSLAVQITEGEFAGVMGRVKRIRGARCVVLTVGKEMAAAVVDVPNKSLRYLTEEEVRQLEVQEQEMNEQIKKSGLQTSAETDQT